MKKFILVNQIFYSIITIYMLITEGILPYFAKSNVMEAPPGTSMFEADTLTHYFFQPSLILLIFTVHDKLVKFASWLLFIYNLLLLLFVSVIMYLTLDHYI